MFVAVALPYSQFLPEQLDVSDPPRQALACHDIKLYFGDIQPAPMLRGVMDLQLSGDPAGFRSRKCLVQGGKGMGVEVVHDKYDPVTVRIVCIYQIPDLLSPIKCGTVLPDTYMPHSTQGFHKYKDTTCAIAHIFGINFSGIL